MKKSSQIPSFGQGLELTNVMSKALASAIKKHDVSSEEVQGVIGKPGQIFDYFDKLFGPNEPEKSDAILSLLSIPETLVLESLDGKATIANAKNTFKSYLDPDFKNWGLNNKGEASKETPIQMYEMAKNANYSQMFNSLSSDLDSLCLTQSQIIRFCEKYSRHLKQEGNATFFLFKENGEYFVARVRMHSGGLLVYVNRFGLGYVWYALNGRRVVVPHLNLVA